MNALIPVSAPRKLARYTPAEGLALEDLYIAGYRAEGRMGRGKAPSFIDGKTCADRGGADVNVGIFDRIVQAVRDGHKTASDIAPLVDLSSSRVSFYLHRIAATGRLRKVGTVKVRNATAFVWGATDNYNPADNLGKINARRIHDGEKARSAILAALRKRPMTKRQMIAATGLTKSTMENALWRLQREGRVRQAGKEGREYIYGAAGK